MRVLIVCAVADEARAAVRGLGPTRAATVGPYGSAVRSIEDDGAVVFTAVACGVGEAAAASATATALTLDPRIDLVLSVGIAGGFAPRVAVGDVVIADRIEAADLGAGGAGLPRRPRPALRTRLRRRRHRVRCIAGPAGCDARRCRSRHHPHRKHGDGER